MKIATLFIKCLPFIKSLLGISSEVVITLAHPESIFKDLLLVPRGSLEWDIMWRKLGKLRINKHLDKPTIANNYGDIWEYMETVQTKFGFKHIFRHRHHPKTDYKVYVEIRASIGFKIISNSSLKNLNSGLTLSIQTP